MSGLGRQMSADFPWSMLSHRAADFYLGCTASVLWRKQCSRAWFVLPSSKLEHVVIPEPSCVRDPFCYLACHSIKFVGSCKMCNLLLFETIYNGKNPIFWAVILCSADVSVVLWDSRVLSIRTRLLRSLGGNPSSLHGWWVLFVVLW